MIFVRSALAANDLDNSSVPHRRWRIAFLLAFGVLVNFFDRINLSVSRDALHASFGLSLVAFGYLSSAFSWTYALMQMPAGMLLDRLGSAPRGADQRVPVERCLLRSCACPRPQLVLRSTLSSGRERIAHVSGECQSAWDTGSRERKEAWQRRSPMRRQNSPAPSESR